MFLASVELVFLLILCTCMRVMSMVSHYSTGQQVAVTGKDNEPTKAGMKTASEYTWGTSRVS